METTLFLIRHGQTAWNEEERFRGRTDLPLDETGLRQARQLGLHFPKSPVLAAIYSSPLQRAMQTAAPMGLAAGLDVRMSDALIDIDYGVLSGLSPEEAARKYPSLYQAWLSNPHTVNFTRGESLSAVRARVADFIWQVAGLHHGNAVVCVTHLAVCRVALCYLLGLPESAYWRFTFDTASVTALRLEQGVATLARANDLSHLAIP